LQYSVSRPVVFETETRLETYESETRKNWSRDSSQERDQVSRLHHWLPAFFNVAWATYVLLELMHTITAPKQGSFWRPSIVSLAKTLLCNSAEQGFFQCGLGTRFEFQEFKIGYLQSEKIIIGSLESEKIRSL